MVSVTDPQQDACTKAVQRLVELAQADPRTASMATAVVPLLDGLAAMAGVDTSGGIDAVDAVDVARHADALAEMWAQAKHEAGL